MLAPLALDLSIARPVILVDYAWKPAHDLQTFVTALLQLLKELRVGRLATTMGSLSLIHGLKPNAATVVPTVFQPPLRLYPSALFSNLFFSPSLSFSIFLNRFFLSLCGWVGVFILCSFLLIIGMYRVAVMGMGAGALLAGLLAVHAPTVVCLVVVDGPFEMDRYLDRISSSSQGKLANSILEASVSPDWPLTHRERYQELLHSISRQAW